MKINLWFGFLHYALIINASVLNAQNYDVYTIAELDSICELYEQKRAFEKGYKYVLLLVERTKNTPEYIQALFRLGVFQQNKSTYEEAEETYYKLLSLLEKDKLEYVEASTLLGNIYYFTGRIREAELQLIKSKRILEQYSYEKEIAYYEALINVLNSLGGIYLSGKNYVKAERSMLDAIAIVKKEFGEKDPKHSLILTNIAMVYEVMGLPEKARMMLAKALMISQKGRGDKHSEYAHLLLETARLHYMYGEVQKGEQILHECFDTLVSNWGYKNKYTLQAIVSLGALNYFKQDYNKSLNHIKECFFLNAVPVIDTSSWENLFETLTTVDFLSLDVLEKNFLMTEANFQSLYQQKKTKKWLMYLYYLYKAQNKINNKIRNSFRTEIDKLKLTRINALLAQKGVDVAIKLGCESCIEGAFLFAEENKLALWTQQLKNDDENVFGQISSTLLEKEQNFQKKLSLIMGQLAEVKVQDDKRDSLIETFNATNQEIIVFEKYLEENYPKYYDRKYNNQKLSLRQLQKSLMGDQVILEYLVTPSNIYVFVITKTSMDVIPLSISKDELGQKIKALRLVLTDLDFMEENEMETYRQYSQTAYWFYENLIAKTFEYFSTKTIKQLVIIPDGELGHLPFEIFLTSLPDTTSVNSYAELPYLLRSYELSYSYSAALWQENKNNQQTNQLNEILAYAPIYNNELDEEKLLKKTSIRLAKIRRGLQSLSENITEVNGLSRWFSGTFRMEEAATERQFKEDLSSHSIIHLATHGILNQENPILSSLAFTEVGDSLEDGFLQGYEISQMDINTQLVVLSACETGFGKFEQGEGVMSLARSFMYAGAPSLIVSLWRVNDLSTSIMMQLFYERISKGQRKSEALQQAKLTYLEHTNGLAAHPVYWAPFIQLGNNAPIILNEKGKGYMQELLIGFGILALLIIGKLYWNPKKAI